MAGGGDPQAEELQPQQAVTVKLFGGLDEQAVAGAGQVRLDPRAARTVAEVIARVGLRPEATGLVLVNGLHTRPAAAVHAGDLVALFPYVSGG